MEDPTQKVEKEQKAGSSKKWRRALPLWLRRLLETLAVVILLPILLFQIPWVQTWTAKKLTKYLSEELKTTVAVGKVQLGLFNKVQLQDFYVEDLNGDTLLFAGNLEVNHSGVFNIFFSKFRIETLRLEDATVHISRKGEEEWQNFQFLLNYFSGNQESKKGKKKPLVLDLRHFYLDRVHFLKPDLAKGETFDVYLDHGEGHFKKFDLLAKQLELSSLDLEKPIVSILLETAQPAGKAPPVNTEAVEAPNDTNKLVISILDFDLTGGRFSLTNKRKEPVRLSPDSVLNYNHLQILDLEIHFNRFKFSDLEFEGEVEKISCRESTGFVLENLSAKQASLSCRGMELYGLQLKTPFTELGDTLIFRHGGGTYHAWEDFVNEVKMDVKLHNSHVAIRDVMKFAPALENNPFFKENKDQVVAIDGLVKGPVNRLDGRNLKISMDEGLKMEGSFSTLNLTVPDEQFLHLKLDKLLTNVRTLRKLIPKFKPTENVDRLGRLEFSGKFDGFFDDFVADGNLRTDLGRAEMFMNLKLRDGKEKARYSGDLYLYEFDLGAWSGNKDLGKVTLDSHVKEGVGLSLSNVSASLEGIVDSLVFKGYKYKNASIKGDLRKNRFVGDFVIDDGNIDLTFGGEINYTDTLPSFNFSADVRKLDLRPLNLTNKDLQFFGKMDLKLRGKSLSDITGTANISNFIIIKNRKDSLNIDTAFLSSVWVPEKMEKVFTLNSTLGDLAVTGNFDIEKIPLQLGQFFAKNYENFAKRINIKPKETQLDTAKFDFELKVYKLQNLVNFFEEKLQGFDESVVKGSFDGFGNTAYLEVEVPSWKYENIHFKDVYFRSKLKGSEGTLQVGVIETAFSETQKLSPVSLIGSIYSDTLEFLIISSNFYKILDNININGILSLDEEDAWRISFKPSDLVVLNETWEMNTANYLRIGGGKVETNNFILSSGQRRIKLNSVRNEGLELELENYPIDSLAFIREIKKHKLAGNANLTARVKNVFKFQGLAAMLRIDSLNVNGDNYGTLRLDASSNSIKETVAATLSIEGDTSLLTANGYFNPPNLIKDPKRQTVKNQALFFDFDVDIQKYPVKIVQYFVPEVLNPKGSLSASNIQFSGLPSKPELSGKAEVNNVVFRIKPLQVTYRVPKGQVAINNRIFDAKDTEVFDSLGNKARLDGGITHNHLKDFGLDLRISTAPGKPFLGLNTTEKDNSTFYGTALGTGYVRFSGTFAQPNLYVEATTSKGTHMFLPMDNSSTKFSTNFIEFKKKPTIETTKPNESPESFSEPRGLNMEFVIDITPDAKMDVVFDKAWGDLLQGTGTGDFVVTLSRNGDFNMRGNFTVVTGNYLFTQMVLGLNKPFIVQPGGTILWTGDPYEADININASYAGLNTSVYNFISEYLTAATDEAKSLARNSSPIDLNMKLTGKLLKPDIAFDIKFSNLPAELRNYCENKMRTVRNDPNELNRQVFGLLILQQFLPSGYTIQAGDVGINTVGEMLSNQLSLYVTEFFSEFLTGNNLVQGIDFDISFNRFTNASINDPLANVANNELRTRLKVIVNDRISLQAGGNFGNQTYTGNNGLLAGEFVIEYVLTKDRRLKLRAFAGTEADIASSRRNRQGIALTYKRDFDSFKELFNLMSQKKKKKTLTKQ